MSNGCSFSYLATHGFFCVFPAPSAGLFFVDASSALQHSEGSASAGSSGSWLGRRQGLAAQAVQEEA